MYCGITYCGIGFKRCLNTFLYILLLAYSSHSHAILGSLAKLGKVTGKVDVESPDLNKIDLDLPIGANTQLTVLNTDINGKWVIESPDGNIPLQQASTQGIDFSNTALLVHYNRLPENMSLFEQLPKQAAVFISTKNGRSFEFVRQANGLQLKQGNLAVNVDGVTGIKEAIYQLERPLTNHKTRYLQVTKSDADNLQSDIYSDKAVVEKVSESHLLADLAQIKYHDIVIAGRVENGFVRFPNSTEKGVAIDELEALANKNSLSIAITDMAKPNKNLKALIKSENQYFDSDKSLNSTTADFFQRLSSNRQMETTLSSRGQLHVAFQNNDLAKSAGVESVKNAGSVNKVGLALVDFVTIIRSHEDVNHEAPPSQLSGIVSSLIGFVFTFFCGLLARQTSEKIWMMFSPIRARYTNLEKKSGRFMHGVNRALFYVIFLPIFGGLNLVIAIIVGLFVRISRVLKSIGALFS